MNKYKNFKDKKWNRENIKELLLTNNRAVAKAILTLYNLQEEDEKLGGVTLHHNNVGFGAVDARYLGNVAKKIMNDNPLTEKEFYIAKLKIIKYSGQLADIANEKEDAKEIRKILKEEMPTLAEFEIACDEVFEEMEIEKVKNVNTIEIQLRWFD